MRAACHVLIECAMRLYAVVWYDVMRCTILHIPLQCHTKPYSASGLDY